MTDKQVKPYELQMREHEIEMSRIWALEDLGMTGDLRGFLHCLRSGNVDEDILRVAADLIEKYMKTPAYEKKVANTDRKFWRAHEIRRAFEHREFDMCGVPVENPKTAQQLAEELAAEHGLGGARQVFNILKSSGYVSPDRGGPMPVFFTTEEVEE